MVRGELEIEWVCEECVVPVSQSTMMEDPTNLSRRQSEIPPQNVSAIMAHVQTSFNDLTPLPDDSANLQAADLPTESTHNDGIPSEETPSLETPPEDTTPADVATLAPNPTPAQNVTPAEPSLEGISYISEHVPMGGAEDVMSSDDEMETEGADPTVSEPSDVVARDDQADSSDEDMDAEATNPAQPTLQGAARDVAPRDDHANAPDEEMETDAATVPIVAEEVVRDVAPIGEQADSSDEEEVEMMVEGPPQPGHESIRIDRAENPIQPRRLSNLAQEVTEPMAEFLLPDTPPSYEILPGASVRGRDLLSDGCGYTYSIRRETSKSISWACSHRGKKCRATLRQVGESYIPGQHGHNHGAEPAKTLRVKTRAVVCIIYHMSLFYKARLVTKGPIPIRRYRNLYSYGVNLWI